MWRGLVANSNSHILWAQLSCSQRVLITSWWHFSPLKSMLLPGFAQIFPLSFLWAHTTPGFNTSFLCVCIMSFSSLLEGVICLDLLVVFHFKKWTELDNIWPFLQTWPGHFKNTSSRDFTFLLLFKILWLILQGDKWSLKFPFSRVRPWMCFGTDFGNWILNLTVEAEFQCGNQNL